MRTRLDAITLKGFKSIRELIDFRPGPLTVLIGPNGAGKSNFLSYFRMLGRTFVDPAYFSVLVAQQGGASKILHDGPAVTREIEAQLTAYTRTGKSEYYYRLFFAAGDTLIFADERYRVPKDDQPGNTTSQSIGAGHRTPQLFEQYYDDRAVGPLFHFLRKISVYQFHNTSETARIRTKWNANDNRSLKEDGGNVAPFLFRLKREEGHCYQRIIDTLRLILPFFSDFELEPEYDSLLLAWREQNSDQIFDVSQASDGMMRMIALVTLLLQPEETLPDVLILDEPELGLHPYAINVIGGLIRAVSTKTQVFVATQSTAFVDCFEPEDIVVVEREGRESTFRRLEDTEELQEWLKEYSLSELWEKNVIGGRP